MTTKYLFSSALLFISLLGFNAAAESVFDEPAVSIRVPGKAQPAPIDLWVEGEITQLDANAGTFTVLGRRMTFIHAYDVDETVPAVSETCDDCNGGCVVSVAESEPPAPAKCVCNEIIVRNVGQAHGAPPPYGEAQEYPVEQTTPTDELVVLEESDFDGRTNLHPKNQLAPIGYIDDPVNCECDQTILSPRTGAPFLGRQQASNEKTEEEAQNVSYEKDGLSYDLSAVPSRSLKNFKAGDRVMVGFAVNDTGNTAYTIIRQPQ